MFKPTRLIYLVLGVLFLVVGIIGLVIPVIPGILFLAAAIYVLSKVSRRVHRFGQGNAVYRHLHDRMNRLGQVGALDRVKLVSLWLMDSVVKGMGRVVTFMSGLRANRAAGRRRFTED